MLCKIHFRFSIVIMRLFLAHFCGTFVVLQEPLFFIRFLYDLSFFLIVIIIIIQNLIFGVIIDTFADLRAEKNRKEEMLKNTCFICGKCVSGISELNTLMLQN